MQLLQFIYRTLQNISDHLARKSNKVSLILSLFLLVHSLLKVGNLTHRSSPKLIFKFSTICLISLVIYFHNDQIIGSPEIVVAAALHVAMT